MLSRRQSIALTFAAIASAGGASTLTACSGKQGKSGSKVTVQIWDPNQQKGVKAALDAYGSTAGASEVQLDVIPEAQYYTKLDAALGAGAGPEVMWQSSKITTYIDGGAIEPLDEYIARDKLDMSIYAPEISALYTIDGKHYGLPKDLDAWVVIYNAKLFAEAGVDEPSAEWTWEDMLKISQALLEASGKKGEICYFGTSLNGSTSDITHQLGGAYISDDGKTATFNTKEVRTAIQYMMDLVDKGYAPDISQKADYDSLASLISGNLYFSTVPSWNIAAVAAASEGGDHFKAVRIPSVNGSYVTNTNGLCYAMNANAADKDSAWDVLKYLASLEGAKAHGAGGAGLPAIAEAQEGWFEVNAAIGNIDVVKDAAANLYLRTTTAYPKARPGMDELSTTIVPDLWARRISVDEFLQQANEIMQKALDA